MKERSALQVFGGQATGGLLCQNSRESKQSCFLG